MKRTFALSALWLLAAVVAVSVAWKGVSVVGDQVTNERPAPLAASEIERRLDEAAATSTTRSSSTPGSSTSTDPTSTTVPGAPPAGAGPTTPTPTAAPPSTTAPPPSTAAPAETRTYSLVGGTASLRFTPAGVEVVFANPASGFTVEVEPEHGNGVKVEFESASHKSRVDGWWDGGPVERVREEPDS